MDHQVRSDAESLFSMDDLVKLGNVVAGTRQGRAALEEVTLVCSVGLAGTEMVLASEAFRRASESNPAR